MGPTLEAIVQGAYAAAKRVRSETPLAEGPVSLVAAALQVARQLHGDLARCRGLLIGLGELSELMAVELIESGVSGITVVHGSSARSETVARRLRGHYRPWDELEPALVEADLVISAVGLGRYAVSASLVDGVLRRRRRRPILLIDTAVPSDVEPAVAELDGAFVYNLDDLEAVARRGRAEREDTARSAWRIIEDEVAGFRRAGAERMAVPAVAQLRGHFEWVRDQVLSQGKMDAETATRLLVKRLLHAPSKTLRGLAAQDRGEAEELSGVLAKLFALEEPARDQPRSKTQGEEDEDK